MTLNSGDYGLDSRFYTFVTPNTSRCTNVSQADDTKCNTAVASTSSRMGKVVCIFGCVLKDTREARCLNIAREFAIQDGIATLTREN